MIDPPDKETLLEAVAQFLALELKGAVADPRLAFRVLIAAHLTATVAAELRGGAQQDAAELARLQKLLPGVDGDLRALNRELAARLRDGRLDGAAALAHLQETLAEKLRVVSPRFELKSEIE